MRAISKTREGWVAEAMLPDCKCTWIEDTKEKLEQALSKDMKKHYTVYFATDDKEMKDYCFKCMVTIMRLIVELEEFPTN